MSRTPGSAVREVIRDIDVRLPGAAFKAKAVEKAADIIDLWWEELNVAKTAATAEEQDDIESTACVSLSRVITAMLTATVSYFHDREAVTNTVSALAFIIAGCEEYLDAEVLPNRDIVDAAALADAEEYDVSET